MSDSGQGQGWWQAADGKWYPPDQHPDFQTPSEPPSEPGPTQAMETVAAPPVPPPMGAPLVGAPLGAPGASSSNGKWIAVGALAVAIVAIAAFLLLRSDDKKATVAVNSGTGASSSSTASSSTPSSSTSSSSSSKSSSSSSSSSSASSGGLSASEIKSRMITASDLGPDFVDDTFQPNNGKPTACGGPSVNSQVPPEIDVGADAGGPGFFEEEVLVFTSEADAKKALQLAKEGLSCPEPTIEGGGPATFSDPTDVSSDIDVPVDEAVRIDVQTEEATGSFFAIRRGSAIASFQFAAQTGTDPAQLPDELKIVNLGLKRLAS